MLNKFSKINKNRGFTLIELLVVIAIIGILSSIVLSSLNIARAKARDARRLSDIKQFIVAVEMYYSQYGYYPQQTTVATEMDVISGLNPLVASAMIPSISTDPIRSSTLPRLRYYYLGIGTAANYSGVSAWYCLGRPRTDYQYSFHFSTENITTNYPKLTNSAGVPNNEYTYCVPGPLR